MISINKPHLTMKMNDYISSFTDQLNEAITIGDSSTFKAPENKIQNILICGLGGSGIGGSIVSDVLSSELTIPVSCSKDYSVPNFVNKNTLVIASSYSGNTEETLNALQICISKGAEIAIITSGGKLKKIAEENNWISESNSDDVSEMISKIINENPLERERLKNGEKKLTGFFIGKIMKATKGTADPKKSNQLLNKLLN